jgi:hypothetical protein
MSEYTGWAILTLIVGPRRLCRLRPGEIREVEIAGARMLRIDIPLVENGAVISKVREYYGPMSVYGIVPCSEAIALEAASRLRDLGPPDPEDFLPPRAAFDGLAAALANLGNNED